jgi:hypothetical protein
MPENSRLISYNGKITRAELAQVPTPPATETHQPIAHPRLVEALVESMSFRHIGVVAEEYVVSQDGMRVFGVLDLETGFEGCRFAIGLRNNHDKSFRLSCTAGVRVFVCENLAFSGDYTAVLAKHSKNFSLEDSLAIGVDRMQRNFEPMRRQVEEWRAKQISTVAAKLIIYQAFVESELDAPKHLARQVHDLYFRPTHPDFEPRTSLHLGVQGTRTDLSVPSYGEACRLSAISTHIVYALPPRGSFCRQRLQTASIVADAEFAHAKETK